MGLFVPPQPAPPHLPRLSRRARLALLSIAISPLTFSQAQSVPFATPANTLEAQPFSETPAHVFRARRFLAGASPAPAPPRRKPWTPPVNNRPGHFSNSPRSLAIPASAQRGSHSVRTR